MNGEGLRVPLVGRTAPWGAVHSALRDAQKSSRNAPAYSRWINRPVGRVFAATGYRMGLTPNAVSVISAVFTFSGIATIGLAVPSIPIGLLVAVLLMLGYALDSADGQIARLQGGGSLAGEWLDHVLDSVKTASIHLAIAVLWMRNLNGWEPWTALVPLGFAVVACVWFFAVIVTELLLRSSTGSRPKETNSPAVWTSIVGVVVDYGFFSMTMVALGWFDLWRVLYVALAVANAAFLAAQLPRWYRRLAAAGDPG